MQISLFPLVVYVNVAVSFDHGPYASSLDLLLWAGLLPGNLPILFRRGFAGIFAQQTDSGSYTSDLDLLSFFNIRFQMLLLSLYILFSTFLPLCTPTSSFPLVVSVNIDLLFNHTPFTSFLDLFIQTKITDPKRRRHVFKRMIQRYMRNQQEESYQWEYTEAEMSKIIYKVRGVASRIGYSR